MDPFESMLLYRCLKNHFTTEKFDYFKYGGKVGNSKAAYEKFVVMPHKNLYHMLSRQPDPESLVIANLMHNPKAFVADIVGDEGQEIYDEYRARRARLMFQLEQELSENDNWRKMVAMADNGLPHIISEYIAGRVSPETVTIVDAFAHRLDDWSKLDHPLMKNVQLRLRKYRPFVEFDKTRAKKVIGKLAGAK